MALAQLLAGIFGPRMAEAGPLPLPPDANLGDSGPAPPPPPPPPDTSAAPYANMDPFNRPQEGGGVPMPMAPGLFGGNTNPTGSPQIPSGSPQIPLPPPQPRVQRTSGPLNILPPRAAAMPAESPPAAAAAPQSFMQALGSPETLSRFLRGLGGGLASVRATPFKGQAFANAMGGGLIAGSKLDDLLMRERSRAALQANQLAMRQRGQDLAAATSRRGQDISAGTARRGQDLTADYRRKVLDRPPSWNLSPIEIKTRADREVDRRVKRESAGLPSVMSPAQTEKWNEDMRKKAEQIRAQVYREYGVNGGGNGAPAQIRSQADFDKLPQGAPYFRDDDPGGRDRLRRRCRTRAPLLRHQGRAVPRRLGAAGRPSAGPGVGDGGRP